MSFASGKQTTGSHGFFIRTTHAFHDDLRSQCTCKAKVLQSPHDFNDFGGLQGSFLESFSLHCCFQLRLDPWVLKNHWFSCIKTMIAPLHVSSTSTFRSSTVLRVRGTLFWPKLARELTKMEETRTVRSEIARGIRSDRSQGP